MKAPMGFVSDARGTVLRPRRWWMWWTATKIVAREAWRRVDGTSFLLNVCLGAALGVFAYLPFAVAKSDRERREAAARFDACVRAGGTVAVSTSGERWCTRGGVR